MSKKVIFVKPKVFLVGSSSLDLSSLSEYLKEVGAEDFIKDIESARFSGLSDLVILSSVFAKLCYKSFVVGTNKNITRVRNISDNVKNCFDTKHGSVFEHVAFNFIIKDCSRIFTHELVRHRVGTAFSQNSGRYIREDIIPFVKDPDLEYSKIIEDAVKIMADQYDALEEEVGLNTELGFEEKKRLTSSIRRILGNGVANDIAFSVNIRELRHVLCMRTSRHAEWEMRYVFDQVYRLIYPKYGLFLHGLNIGEHKGLIEISEQ